MLLEKVRLKTGYVLTECVSFSQSFLSYLDSCPPVQGGENPYAVKPRSTVDTPRIEALEKQVKGMAARETCVFLVFALLRNALYDASIALPYVVQAGVELCPRLLPESLTISGGVEIGSTWPVFLVSRMQQKVWWKCSRCDRRLRHFVKSVPTLRRR